MSDDIADNEPDIIGDPMTDDDVAAQVAIVMPQDEIDAVDWWNSIASDLFIDAIGEG